jgi:hypothetical protein
MRYGAVMLQSSKFRSEAAVEYGCARQKLTSSSPTGRVETPLTHSKHSSVVFSNRKKIAAPFFTFHSSKVLSASYRIALKIVRSSAELPLANTSAIIMSFVEAARQLRGREQLNGNA